MLCLQSHHFSSLFSLNFYLEKPQEKSEEEKSEERREQKEKPHFRATFLFGGELGIRTLGSLWEHSISSAAPSTSRTTLRVCTSIRFFLRSNFGQKIFREKSRREY